MLRAFPLIFIAVIAYNILVFGGATTGHDMAGLLGQNFPLTVMSGDVWKITLGDGLVALALVMLFIETVKAARTSQREMLNHALSLVTFIVALVEFITLKGFGTSVFFLIAAMCLFDVVAGYSIAVVAAKRDFAVAPTDPA